MELLGFTIIRTKELEELKAENLQLSEKFSEGIIKLIDAGNYNRDIELRKWCVEHSAYKTLNQCAHFTYRYVKHGDTSAIEDYKEFLDWRKKKDDAKASESHPEAHLQ